MKSKFDHYLHVAKIFKFFHMQKMVRYYIDKACQSV